MGRNSYLGGGTTIRGGQWSSYDPQEVRNPLLSRKPDRPDPASVPQRPDPAAPSKASRKAAAAAPSRASRKAAAAALRQNALLSYALLCAAADRKGVARPPRPASVKKGALRHQKQRDKFETLVRSFL